MNKLYLIGNAHLDPVWLWNWKEGFSEILATFRSALDRMNDFPDFKFTSACAVYYEWVEKTDPEMFDEIQQRVKEGRWNIVGGWFLQPDCNMPNGESFARHALVSQRYFKEKFGVTAHTGYNVDSFGHNAALPQILKLSGMDNYVFMRPGTHENAELTDLFNWESADGSSVRTYRLPNAYCSGSALPKDIQPTLNRIDNLSEKRNAHPMMEFYGVGNHGGGPTIELISAIKEHECGEKEFSTPDEFFADTEKLELPTHKGELQNHARGCYSVNSYVKKTNRAAEYSLLAAETICSLAEELVGAEYPDKKIKKGWKNLMFDQFHDILGGCSIKSAYTDVSYLFGEIKSITEQETFKAMTRICRKIDTLKDATLPSAKTEWRLWSCENLGTPFIVFNPHAWEVEAVIKLSGNNHKVTDDSNSPVPCQTIRAEQTNGGADKYSSVFKAKVPALGYKLYRVFEGGEAVEFAPVKVTENSLENELIRVTFDKSSGGIAKIFDKRKNEEIDCSTGTALLDETKCDTWAHDKVTLGDKIGEFGEPIFEIIESGAVFAKLRVTTRFNDSTLKQDYILTADSDSVKVNAEIDFHEKHRTFKLTLPAGNNVTAAIPFGHITRKLGTGEEPCGEWLASGKIGFTSDISYGYDTDGDKIRPTIFRSAIYADHFGVRDDACEYMEQGVSRFNYEIFIYSTASDAKRRADEFNSPMLLIQDTFHKGELGSEYTAVSGSIPENLVVTAVKRGEDGGRVVRFAEYDGTAADTAFKINSCEVKCSTKAYEIKTLHNGVETDLIEW